MNTNGRPVAAVCDRRFQNLFENSCPFVVEDFLITYLTLREGGRFP